MAKYSEDKSMRYRVQHQHGNGPYAMYKIVCENYTIHENLTIDAAKQLCRCLNDR